MRTLKWGIRLSGYAERFGDNRDMMIALALLFSQPKVDDAAVVKWLKATAIPLKTVVAGSGFGDLESLGRHLKGVRIVGMGEPTHGTREAFLFKHRMFEYLVERHGYRIFAIEASFPDCLPIEKYIQTGEGDPEAAVHGQGFWTWDTEEVLGLVQWMYTYNQGHQDKLHFVGFDMQSRASAYAKASEYWKTWQPASTSELGKDPTTNDLAALSSLLTKHRTELIRKSGKESYEIACQCAAVAGQASKIDQKKVGDTFKALVTAIAQLAEDTKLLKRAGFDTSYLDDLIKGMNDGSAGASATGRALVKLRAAADKVPSTTRPFVNKVMSDLDELGKQAALIDEGSGWRDRCMAENTTWIVERLYPDSKAMLWAHNYHVGASVPEDNTVDTMGRYLTKRFKNRYFPVGFSFGQGEFQARLMSADGTMSNLQAFTVGPPAPGSLDETLGKACSQYIVALDPAPKEVRLWLDQPHLTRTCGSAYDPVAPESAYRNDRPGKWFRAIVYLSHTTRSRPLKLTRERYGLTKDWQ